ncbi:unnamed protein product [Prorocentrum cordatum]|uniref:Uncharacterized protein n=1 Tax=Prorocentrum cordatum TaxID=2364126 RepID=A0ABN9UCW8_9DINO|nr:unnamed protein product [Polarella glacialis]
MAALPAAAQRGGAPSSGEDPSGMPSASSTARCQQPRRKTGDVVGHDWSKLVIRQADSDRMLEELQAGNCICEDMDDIPGDTYKHPLSRLHYEQLDRQRPRGPELAGPSEAPHLRLRTLRAEERFGRRSRTASSSLRLLPSPFLMVLPREQSKRGMGQASRSLHGRLLSRSHICQPWLLCMPQTAKHYGESLFFRSGMICVRWSCEVVGCG